MPPRRRPRGAAVLDGAGTTRVEKKEGKLANLEAKLDREPLTGTIGIGHTRSLGIKSGVLVDLDAAERAIRHAVEAAERMAGVTVDPDTGETKFATTQREHDNNVKEFQQWCSDNQDRC